MRRLSTIAAMLSVLALAPLAGAQANKDPLNDDEVDQIREVADRPVERVKLYMKFIEQRTAAIKQMSGDPLVQNRPAKLRNLMEEFTRLSDELQDNLDNYDTGHYDVRKALKDLIAESARWPDVFKLPPPDPGYDFSRKMALEAAQSANEQATKMLEDQKTYFAKHNKKDSKSADPSDDAGPDKSRPK